MPDSATSAMISVLSGFAAGALVVEAVGDIVAFAAGVTAFIAAALRYRAVLRGADDEAIDRATAYGFFIGLAAAVFFIAVDAVA